MDVTELVRKHVDSLQPRSSVLIGGRWIEPADTFDVDDPSTGTVIARVGDGTREHASAAVSAAHDALPRWRSLAPRERSEILRRAYELMVLDVDNLAQLIMAENGKSEVDARGEVTYAAEFFRWFAEEAVRSNGRYGEAPAGGARVVVTHRPVGVAALVTPWNFPAAMVTRKLAPALAAGCTTVLKPAAETPLTALAVARILGEAGVPDGVVNVVPSLDAPGVVTTWLEDPRVRKVSFTGSTNVGRILLRQAADRVVNSSMELGGNAPFVVTEDADLEAAVAGAVVAKFRNGGQACTAANRFYVHEAVVEEFTERLAAAAGSLRIGPSADPASRIGPVISARALSNITALVDRAVEDGARVHFVAPVSEELTGYFCPPMILREVRADAEIVQQEIFGPVAPIVTWRTDEELLEYVNASEYGLAAYVFAGELQRAIRIAEATEAGMIGINRGLVSDPSAPFGGMKQSGLGREGAREGLEEFTETQYLSLDWPA
jgi:succinate-semialdehyde dehydrogenase/glutarate-semialdehyde dehydrogenase